MAGPYTQENHISAQTQILSTDIDTGGSRRRLLQLWVAHEHPRKLYISKDTDTPVCIHNIDIWQIKGEKHGHNDGTGDSRRQGSTQAHREGELFISRDAERRYRYEIWILKAEEWTETQARQKHR